jgi:glycosyltransferase involved in cell wall biosynthesis
MNLQAVSEHRFHVCPDGSVWTSGSFGAAFWRNYLPVFDAVRVVARLKPVRLPSPDWIRADDQGISFEPIPHYHGPAQFVARFVPVIRALHRAMENRDAVLLRVPATLANLICPSLVRAGRPYGVEVVGDPYEVYAPGAASHPLRPLFRWWFTHSMKTQCRHAAASAYVTAANLPLRYPVKPGDARQVCVTYSDVELPPDAFAGPFGAGELCRRRWDVVFAGSLDQRYKGLDTLLRALSVCHARGVPLTCCVIGAGRHEPEYRSLASRLGLGTEVHFAGQVPGSSAVREYLDQSKVFVLPSRTEGMPRALLEAMARGLPCVGSSVGGIPEVLAPPSLVPPEDFNALAYRLILLLSSPAHLEAESIRNHQRANCFAEAEMCQHRTRFLTALREATESWNPGAALAESGFPAPLGSIRQADQ